MRPMFGGSAGAQQVSEVLFDALVADELETIKSGLITVDLVKSQPLDRFQGGVQVARTWITPSRCRFHRMARRCHPLCYFLKSRSAGWSRGRGQPSPSLNLPSAAGSGCVAESAMIRRTGDFFALRRIRRLGSLA